MPVFGIGIGTTGVPTLTTIVLSAPPTIFHLEIPMMISTFFTEIYGNTWNIGMVHLA